MTRPEKEPTEDILAKAEREAAEEAIWSISEDHVEIHLKAPVTLGKFSIIDLETSEGVNLAEGIRGKLKDAQEQKRVFPEQLVLPQNPDIIN